MFDKFKKEKNKGIPTPESIYAVTILATTSAAIITSCFLEHISNKMVLKGQPTMKENTSDHVQINRRKENTTTLFPIQEEPINLMPYFQEEANNLYREHAIVIYRDKVFHLKDLYTLTNEDNSYLCYLDEDSYYYRDIITDSAIAINGYEDLFNYKVNDLFYLFPYDEKYGTPEESLIPEEEFQIGLQSLNLDSSEKQYTKKR